MAEDQPETPPGFVPVGRLSAESKLKNEARAEHATAMARVSELEAQLTAASAKASEFETLTTTHAEATAGWLAKEQGWAETESIYRTGITDPDAIDVARMFHGKMAEGDRPPIAEWLEALKADPTTAPRALAPYLGEPQKPPAAASPPPAADPPAAAAPPEPPAPPPAKPAGGTVPSNGAPATGAVYSPLAIKNAREEMARGNLEPYKAMRDHLLNRKR